MKVSPLATEDRHLYFWCLEDWSKEATQESGQRKEIWYTKKSEKGLRVQVARDERGEIGGMIHYLPIEHSVVNGEGLYFICCIWVHGHKQGRGNFQGKGMGKALLQAAENDARQLGAKGMAAILDESLVVQEKWVQESGQGRDGAFVVETVLQ
jgi:GNAT superfamily N-acetyltransferase